jgi:chromosome segregation ATPase
MRLKYFCLLVMFISSVSWLTAQETKDYVDVKESNEEIARLERTNENHNQIIASNKERISLLENRIQTSETRLSKIQENLEYAQETNRELNTLNSETRDKATREKLAASRAELMSFIWILTTEEDKLTTQTEEDKKEVVFLTGDIARRESLIERNNGVIAPLKESVSYTESKISEISSKLNTIIGKLDTLKEDVTTKTNP